MPLRSGGSRAVVSANISELVHSGLEHDRAVAAAMNQARAWYTKRGKPIPDWLRKRKRKKK